MRHLIQHSAPLYGQTERKLLCAAVLRVADAGESAVKVSAGLLFKGVQTAGRGAALSVNLGMNVLAGERSRGAGSIRAARQVLHPHPHPHRATEIFLFWSEVYELPCLSADS